jgi:hypothetical protein
MANGSVLIVGGETGANAPANPTLEILPRIPGGDTQIFLDWLNRTDPNNLYPFLHLLPSGKIFAGGSETTNFLDTWIPLLTYKRRILQRGTPP